MPKIYFMQAKSFKILFFFSCMGILLTSCTTTKTSSSSSRSVISAEQKMRTNIITYAKKYEGIKYKYAGKDPKGFDCSGFTHYVFKNFNIPLSGSSSAQSKQGQEIPIAKARKGDLIFFGRNGRNGKIQHVGIIYSNTDNGLYMIHSSSKRGIVVDNVTTSTYWKPKILFI